MTDKDPNDMTVSELLREADSNPCSMCHLVMTGDESCATTGCASWAYRLADKIDAELAEARELSLRRGAELWAKANGWPDFRDGEDFGAWLDRCAIPRPRFEDGEPVQSSDMEEIGAMATYRVYMDGCWEFDPDKYEDERNPKPWDVQFGTRNDRVKRPAPEALGADGKPIVVGETVWLTDEGKAHTGSVDFKAGPRSYGLFGVEVGEPLTVLGFKRKIRGSDHRFVMFDHHSMPWCDASWITHTPPDTLERLRDDIAEWRADCANPGSGWDVKTAEWADRIDAIIRRKGSAE